jgi:Glycosyl hydrolase family 26
MFWDGTRWIDERTAARPLAPSTPKRGPLRSWLAALTIIISAASLAVPVVLAGTGATSLSVSTALPGARPRVSGLSAVNARRAASTTGAAPTGALARLASTAVTIAAGSPTPLATPAPTPILVAVYPPLSPTPLATPAPTPILVAVYPPLSPTPPATPAPTPILVAVYPPLSPTPVVTPASTLPLSGSTLAPPAASTPVLPASPIPGLTPAPTPSRAPASTLAPTPTPAHTVVLGAYIPGAPSDPTKIDEYASLTGGMPHIVMWFQDWTGPWNSFYASGADAIRTRGAMPLITWEPWAGTVVDPQWSLNTIINGSHDAYIHQWTHDVAAWGHPIYVRPMHEMNGGWTSWGYGVNGNTAAQFVTAWRHIVDIARAEGATNIRWVWSPNVDDGNPGLTPYVSVYPGDAYVDWVGLDGYNWGTSKGWNGWQSLYDTFKGSVDKIAALTSKPLMIAETASTELGGDKAAWITTGFASLLTALPRVRAVVWFDKKKETDWRVASSTQSLNAFRAVATSAAVAATLP